MTDLLTWSIDLGRWGGTRVRIHLSLVILVVLTLFGAITTETARFLPTLAWLGLLLVVLALHELGHVAAAAWQDAEVEDILIWPGGNLIGPSNSKSNENPLVLAGGLVVSGTLALTTALLLSLFGARMVLLNVFGNATDSGAPTVLVNGVEELARPLSAIWYAGWFGWLNWVIFLLNLLPALPFDMGRIVRVTVARPGLGLARDTMAGPWAARTVASLLVVIGIVRLIFYQRLSDTLTLIILALMIEMFVRAEARMMEDGSFFDDGVFGYDFSEGYTSLESSTAKVRPQRESALKRWRRKRSELRKQRRQAQFAADDRRLDEILDKLHQQGKSSLTDEENRFLIRVSSKIKKRAQDRD